MAGRVTHRKSAVPRRKRADAELEGNKVRWDRIRLSKQLNK